MIEFKNIRKVYKDGTEALADFSLKINKGELVTLIGPSGCGKTTTMKMVNRLIEPTAGTIYINDQDIKNYNIHALRWNIGYVLQEIALFPHLNIAENIAIVPEMKRWKQSEIRKRTKELLEMVGLDPDIYQKRMPCELSGGQQQRIGVIRALAAAPDIILMDEPFSALDPISRDQLKKDIRSLQKKIKKTILFVTHDIEEAMALGDRVCLMKDGRIIQVDTPQQLILYPKTAFVEEFIGASKSHWQTAVDIISDKSQMDIVSETVFRQGQHPKSGIYIIRDENNIYAGAIEDGEQTDVITLNNNTPLYKAVEIMQKSKQSLFPVLKENKLVGVLRDRDIVLFLKSKIKLENGLIK